MMLRMIMEEKLMKKNLKICVLFLLVMLISGCGSKIKDENELKQDLLSNKDFWIADDWEVTDFEIIKRLTEKEQSKDTVYVSMKVGNEFYYQTMAYAMYYTEYNEGWLLDSIEQYYGSDFEYMAVPLKIPTREAIFEEVKSNSDISVRSFFEEHSISSVKDLYFFEDGKYTYTVENEVADLESGSYSCQLVINRKFELVTVHEVIDVMFWFESYNPDFFGWNLASAEISETTYDWDIEGTWIHPSAKYPIVVSGYNNASEPTIDVTFTGRGLLGKEWSKVESFNLAPVNSERIQTTWCYSEDSLGIELFIITPDAVVDSEGNSWVRVE